MRAMLDRAVRFGADWRAAVGAAILLLAIGVVMALLNERGYDQQKARESSVQAQIVSASVAPALMFDDSANAQAYLNALSANPAIAAAAVYQADGARLAAFVREGAAPPPSTAPEAGSSHGSRFVVAVTPVMRDDVMLGSVYLRSETATALQRFSRYGAIGVLLLLGVLVLTVSGLAQGALSEANKALTDRAAQLQQEVEQRERAEEELLQSRKMEAIGQLTGGVAHDFNNLLTIIASGLRLIDRDVDAERRNKLVEAMRQAVERGAGLTRQLLAFSRRQTLRLETMDVGASLRGMREMLERSLRADIVVDISAPEDLWSVRTDPTQFELAILNLAVNARDAMPKGGMLLIAARNAPTDAGDFIDVSVRDTGVGIPAAVLPRVFEPYFTTKHAGQGTGLGLSQVYGIVAQSGGEARIESTVNEGATITLRLPRSTEDAKVSVVAVGAPTTIPAGTRVLIVEDDNSVAAMVEEMLEQLYVKAQRVDSAEAALALLQSGAEFDVVFSDIIMPGAMNGVELAREIGRRWPQVPVLLTTGYSGGADVGEEFTVLRKPYRMEDLQRSLANACAVQPVDHDRNSA